LAKKQLISIVFFWTFQNMYKKTTWSTSFPYIWACEEDCGVSIWDYFSIHMSSKLEKGHWISWTWWVWRLLLTNLGDDSQLNRMWLKKLLQTCLKALKQHGCVLWESCIGQYVLAKIRRVFLEVLRYLSK
jgi:hypothetical protein